MILCRGSGSVVVQVSWRRFFSSRMMKAIRVSEFGPPSVLTMKETEVPTAGPGECLVKLHASGVNPVDTYIRSGSYGKLPDLPYTPGKDGSGVVEEVGAEVSNVKVGDRVYIFNCLTGSYARYGLCAASNVFHLPKSMSFEQGACLGTPAFTAYRALFIKGRGRPGDTVFIHGASGGVGLMAIQLATFAGMTVVGTASTEEGMNAILKSGATAAYNHGKSDYLSDVSAAHASGFDICIEMLANENLGVDLPLMAPNGRVCVVGSRGEVKINPRDLMTKELEVYGVALLRSSASEVKEAAGYVNVCMKHGSLIPLISMQIPIDEASTAHCEVIDRGKVKAGNIVLTW